jgi:hypothetical protein
MAIIYPDVLYDNLLRRGTVTYSGTEVVGFETANAYDWRDFSVWTKPTGVQYLTVDLGASGAAAVDAFVAWPVKGAEPSSGVYLEYADTLGLWTSFTTLDGAALTAAAGSPAIITPVGGIPHRYWRVGCNTAGSLRQVAFGQRLTMLRGQWQGVAPTKFIGGNVFSNMIAENGSILGRNVRRTEKKGELSLSHLTDTWVRASWEPFVQHATRFPFFYRWNPSGKPADVAFAAATEIDPPTNDSPPPFLRASLPMRLITE